MNEQMVFQFPITERQAILLYAAWRYTQIARRESFDYLAISSRIDLALGACIIQEKISLSATSALIPTPQLVNQNEGDQQANDLEHWRTVIGEKHREGYLTFVGMAKRYSKLTEAGVMVAREVASGNWNHQCFAPKSIDWLRVNGPRIVKWINQSIKPETVNAHIDLKQVGAIWEPIYAKGWA